MRPWCFFSLALSSCVGDEPLHVRRPCPDDTAWDPNRPLAIRWADSGLVDLNEHVARRISVVDAEFAAVDGVPFAFPGGLGWCALGGLTPDAEYHWTVTTGDEPRVQEWDTLRTERSGTWTFRTAATAEVAAPADVAACRKLARNVLYDEQCAQFLDSADTASAP